MKEPTITTDFGRYFLIDRIREEINFRTTPQSRGMRYLACEAIGAGTCAIAAYNQTLTDSLLGVDGIEEFCIYIAPVGKVPCHP
jgi:hypothetical protein